MRKDFDIPDEDVTFLRKAMRVYKIDRVKLKTKPEWKKKHPDIWVEGNGLPTITVTPEWRKQRRAERQKRLVHELEHLTGRKHGNPPDYSTYPDQDEFSKRQYKEIAK